MNKVDICLMKAACRLFIIILVLNINCSDSAGRNNLRIGYATEDDLFICSLGQILERTDILGRNNIKGEFVLYANSFEVMWSLIEEDVEVIVAPDETLISILLSGVPVEVVASFNVNSPVALVVPPGSPVKTVADLKNGTIANPVDVIRLTRWLNTAGIKPDEINIDLRRYFSSDLIRYDFDDNKIDALVLRGGLLKYLSESRKVKIVAADQYDGHVIVLKKTAENSPEKVINFLTGVHEAVRYQQSNQETIVKWPQEISLLWKNAPAGRWSANLNFAPDPEKIKPATNFIQQPDKFGLIKHLCNYIDLLKGETDVASAQLAAGSVVNKTLSEKALARFNQAEPFDASRVKVIHASFPTAPFDDIILQMIGIRNELSLSNEPGIPFESELMIIEDDISPEPDK